MQLQANLVQLSSKLLAEIEQPHKLSCEADPASENRTGQALLFEFQVPDVERKTRFEWRFAHCETGDEGCQELLSVPFLAYPSDLLDPARRWAKDNVLLVEDKSGQLQDFLDQQGIEFFEGSAPRTPGGARTTLVVESDRPLEPHDLARHMKRGGVVLLREGLHGLPHIKSIVQDGHRLVSVEFPFLAALRSQPAAQEIFIDILRLSLE